MATHHLEVERKYEMIDPDGPVTKIDWSGLDQLSVGEVVGEHLEATYYDTATGALGRNMVALRRRLGGYDQGWHIKFDDRAGARHEIHYDLVSSPKQVPAAVQRFVRTVTQGEELVESVSLVTERERTVLQDRAGTQVAEICDDTVVATDYSTGLERRWHEWEIELLDRGLVSASDIFSLCEEVLFPLGVRLSGSPAKIARALGKDPEFEARRLGQDPVRDERESETEPAGSTRRRPAVAADLLRVSLGGLTTDLMLWELKFRAGAPDAVHGLRRTTRKLESVLRFAARPYARAEADRLEFDACAGALKHLVKKLSPARDIDIVADYLAGAAIRPGAVSEDSRRVLDEFLDEDRVETQTAVLRALDTEEYLRLRKALLGVVSHLEDTVVLPATVASYVGEVAHRIGECVRDFGRGDLGQLWKTDPNDFAYNEFNNDPLFRIRRAAQAGSYCLSALVQAGAGLSEDQQKLLETCAGLHREISVLSDEQVTLVWLESVARRARYRRLDRLGVGYLMGRSSYYAVGLRMSEHSFVAGELAALEGLSFR